MNDNIFDNLEPVHMPSLDLTRSFELSKSVQAHMDESQRHMEQISRSAYEERRRTQEAIERTAENTAQTNISSCRKLSKIKMLILICFVDNLKQVRSSSIF